MSAWRMRPPPTLQGALTCWAAAISSFGRVTRGVPDWATPGDVVKHFKSHLAAELNGDGSLKTPSGWVAFAKAFGGHSRGLRACGAPPLALNVGRLQLLARLSLFRVEEAK